MITRRQFFPLGAAAGAGILMPSFWKPGSVFASGALMDPRTQPQFVKVLPKPAKLTGTHHEIAASQLQQDLGLVDPITSVPLMTTVWGYHGSSPGPTIEAVKGQAIDIRWMNHLMDVLHPLPVDQTLHWADPMMEGHTMNRYTGPVPIVTHIHGAECESQSDGHPDAWFTPHFHMVGMAWEKEVYHYVNSQKPTTLWYHDHTMGITRLNVYMGLAGFYLLRDPGHEPVLPNGNYEQEIVIQDRMFYVDGQLAYPEMGVNPEVHPFWVPEFHGDHIMVNGVIWPYMNVEPRKYRIRFLNGSNARFYSLKLFNDNGSSGPKFTQIGADGGFLASPVVLNNPTSSSSPRLSLAPGERADVIIDFRGIAPGTKFILNNNASSHMGPSIVPETTGRIMQFRVVAGKRDSITIPSTLTSIPTLTQNAPKRQLVLSMEGSGAMKVAMGGMGGGGGMDDGGGMGGGGMGGGGGGMGGGGMGSPTGLYLNGMMWCGMVTEMPILGTTEVWEFINVTMCTHPMHLHLVQFQLLNRQSFMCGPYRQAFESANPEGFPSMMPTTIPDVAPYLSGSISPASGNEKGWKDVIKCYPHQVTRIIVRFAPQDGAPNYAFDAASGPGYVWHCHIIDHEDNEMMRPYKVVASASKMVSGSPEPIVLEQNFPNPFNPLTTIKFQLASSEHVELKVFNTLGQEVRTLANMRFTPGTHGVVWDGKSNGGRAVASGVYIYRIVAGKYTMRRKMNLMR